MLLHLAPVVVLVLLVLGVVATVPIGSQTPPSIARQPVLRPVRLGDRTRRRTPTVWTRLRLQRLVRCPRPAPSTTRPSAMPS